MTTNEILRGLELILAGICIARFGWGVLKGFTRPDGLRVLPAVSVACAVLTAVLNLVALVWFKQQGVAGTVAGIALYTLAWGLFEWTFWTTRSRRLSIIYSNDLPKHLESRGPYQFIRHPYYSSFLLGWLAGCVATGQVLLLIPLGVMFVFYNIGANREEAKFAASSLAQKYEDYRARTGKYLPRLYNTKKCLVPTKQ